MNYPGNINNSWFCSKCGYPHSVPYCPYDDWQKWHDSFADNRSYETCPHCGKLIKEKE